MAHTHKISPFIAVLICVNTMIGAGLFINPKPLTALAGPLGFLGYIFSAIFLLPLILSIAALAKLHPVSGGLYVYSTTYVNKWAGFLSGWCYFIGKTTTVAILVHKIMQFFQESIPFLAHYPTLALDYALIFALVLLNIIGVQVGGRIQYFFAFLKATPVIFTFVVGFAAFNISYFQPTTAHFWGSLGTIPLTVFALLGFDIICSIGHLIKDAEKNIKPVILISFISVAIIATFFQFVIFGALGSGLGQANTPLLMLGDVALPITLNFLGRLVNGFVFAAFLAGSFSILTSNCWNLYTIAHNNHIPGRRFFTLLTSAQVPWIALIFEGFIGCLVLALCSEQVVMQNMSVFAQVISFLLTAIAAYIASRVVSKDIGLPRWIPILGIGSCCYILFLAFSKIMASGISLPFVGIFLIGGFAALVKKWSAAS